MQNTNFLEAFRKPGHWLKVALHNHTTNSDGQLAPAEAALFYKALGYDAFAFTDHMFCTPVEGVDAPGITLIPGVELHGEDAARREHHHVVALGLTESMPRDHPERHTLRGMVNWVKAQGGLALAAHPHGSNLSVQSLVEAEPWGMEILSTFSDESVYWDRVLRQGKWAWGAGVDDTHQYLAGISAGVAWVMVKAEANTAESILAALREGHFYTTNGPLFTDVRVEGKEIAVTGTPVQAILQWDLGSGPLFESRAALGDPPGSLVTAGRFSLEKWDFFRLELRSPNTGGRAWSQPLAFK